ncbi:MAG: hypothetical protein ACHP7P_14285 [Terriglobales bacterium]
MVAVLCSTTPAQVLSQTPSDWRPFVNGALGFSFFAGRRSHPDTLPEALGGIGLHAGLGLAVESPSSQLSAHLDATIHRYTPFYLICFDACPKSGIPTAVAGLRLGGRWRWPDIFPHRYVTAGVGVYEPVGASPHWHGTAAGYDVGLGFLRAQGTQSFEYRVVWLPSVPNAPLLVSASFGFRF